MNQRKNGDSHIEPLPEIIQKKFSSLKPQAQKEIMVIWGTPDEVYFETHSRLPNKNWAPKELRAAIGRQMKERDIQLIAKVRVRHEYPSRQLVESLTRFKSLRDYHKQKREKEKERKRRRAAEQKKKKRKPPRRR